MSDNRKNFPNVMTLKNLIIYIITVIAIGLFFFFIKGDMSGKICACIVCPMLIGYLIYAYRKEHKADKNAEEKNEQIIDGYYFESPEWHTKYVTYINENPLKKIEYPSMRQDLLKRFQRREYMTGMLVMLFLKVK